jgi:predicted Zn-dependent peptidase
MHNCIGILPGAAHMLEHNCCNRSERYSENGSFKKFVELNGGMTNATTFMRSTQFIAEVPYQHMHATWDGLVSQVFEPIFKAHNTKLEATIISNERNDERWYPAGNELGHYLSTHVYFDHLVSLRQTMGSDKDLEAFTPALLRHYHRYYFSPKVYAIVAGEIDSDYVCETLERIPTEVIEMPIHFETPRWVKKEYHERKFRDVGRWEYRLSAMFHEPLDVSTIEAINFILEYMANTTHGPLYEWLRTRKGITYDTNPSQCVNEFCHGWTVLFPMSNRSHVKYVRDNVYKQMRKALRDRERLNLEADRILNGRIFNLQTIGSQVDVAQNDLRYFDRIVTETEINGYINKMRNVDFVQTIYNRYFAPEHVGEFCAVPES